MSTKDTTLEWADFVVTARKYKTTYTAKYLGRKRWKKPMKGEVFSLLPGTILSVSVKIGSSVKVGDLLLMQESMKMHNRVVAPVSGKVTEVRVSTGDRVPKDYMMIKIE